MSYDPDFDSYSEFLWAYGTSSQSLPSVNLSTTLTNYGEEVVINSYKSTNTGASLASNEISTNNSRAFWLGDIRSNTNPVRRKTEYTIEFETNELIRNAASQDEGSAACRDEVCYGVSSKARIEMNLVKKMYGSTTAGMSRILGMVLST
tara:strand:+ start:1368 stop:1814 length:447 start_codon:yes stop_codon:yes gene_type:complete